MNAVLVISPRDNVATALEPIEAGRRVQAGPVAIVAVEAIPRGHKIALTNLMAGDNVIKFGSPIGTATTAIAAGAHVHSHNLSSTRGRGDLTPYPPARETRIAEPVDSADIPEPEPKDA